MLRRFAVIGLLLSFIISSLALPPAWAIEPLPNPGKMVNLSPAFEPVLIKGLRVYPDNPFKFDFVLTPGEKVGTSPTSLKNEANRLIKYFLTALTVPEKNLWVNLSPYEKERMINPDLGQTEMGRDLLAQDYLLKQITASLIYPEHGLGKEFWQRIYAKAKERYGVTEVPVNTFNKIWIVAQRADIVERDNTVFITSAHLKVMLEEDYRALNKNKVSAKAQGVSTGGASQIIRELIVPEIEKEVNQGKNFAPLRQMFYSMILAAWYKQALKESLLGQTYRDQSKVANLNTSSQDQVLSPEHIYEQYVAAYKKGVFNYIKEDIDLSTQERIPKKYFSGGFDMAMLNNGTLHRQASLPQGMLLTNDAVIAQVNMLPQSSDPAMMSLFKKIFSVPQSPPSFSSQLGSEKVDKATTDLSNLLKGKRVLVVDDNQVTRKMISELLVNQGAIVKEADDGDNGFQAYLKGNFDLVISDLMMPRVNGDVFYKNVKRVNPKANIFVWTSTPTSMIATAAVKEGVLMFSKNESLGGIIAKVWSSSSDGAMTVTREQMTMTINNALSLMADVQTDSQQGLFIFSFKDQAKVIEQQFESMATKAGFWGEKNWLYKDGEKFIFRFAQEVDPTSKEPFGRIRDFMATTLPNKILSYVEGDINAVLKGLDTTGSASKVGIDVKQIQTAIRRVSESDYVDNPNFSANGFDFTRTMTFKYTVNLGYINLILLDLENKMMRFFPNAESFIKSSSWNELKAKYQEAPKDVKADAAMMTQGFMPAHRQEYINRALEFFDALNDKEKFPAMSREMFLIYILGDPITEVAVRFMKEHHLQKPFDFARLMAVYGLDAKGYDHFKIDPGSMLNTPDGTYTIRGRLITKTVFTAIAAHATELFTRFASLDKEAVFDMDKDKTEEETLDSIEREYTMFYLDVHKGVADDIHLADNLVSFELARRKLPVLRIIERLRSKKLDKLESLKPLLGALMYTLSMKDNESFLRQMVDPVVMKHIFDTATKELIHQRRKVILSQRQLMLVSRRDEVLRSMNYFATLTYPSGQLKKPSIPDSAMLTKGGIDLNSQQMVINSNRAGKQENGLDKSTLSLLTVKSLDTLDFTIEQMVVGVNPSVFLNLN